MALVSKVARQLAEAPQKDAALNRLAPTQEANWSPGSVPGRYAGEDISGPSEVPLRERLERQCRDHSQRAENLAVALAELTPEIETTIRVITRLKHLGMIYW